MSSKKYRITVYLKSGGRIVFETSRFDAIRDGDKLVEATWNVDGDVRLQYLDLDSVAAVTNESL